MKIMQSIADKIVSTIVSNIKLDEALLLCAMKAEQENRKTLAAKLKNLKENENGSNPTSN